MRVVTTIQYRDDTMFRHKTISGVMVQVDTGKPRTADIHVWSRGGGAGELSVATQDAMSIIERMLDLSDCECRQETRE